MFTESELKDQLKTLEVNDFDTTKNFGIAYGASYILESDLDEN